MMANQQMVSQPAPYLLGPATGTASGAANANGAAKPPVVTAANGRPVTRKDAIPKTTSASAPAAAKRVNGHQPAQPGMAVPPMAYGDGTAVDATNQTEVQTYRRYLAEKQTPPLSKGALLAYYREVVA
jgi:hypothetical protein